MIYCICRVRLSRKSRQHGALVCLHTLQLWRFIDGGESGRNLRKMKIFVWAQNLAYFSRRSCINNYIHIKQCDIIAHPRPNVDSSELMSNHNIQKKHARWRHQMETFSALLAICAGNSPVPAEFPTQGPVTRSFDVFFDLLLNKRLSKQSWGWRFETLSRPLWRQWNVDNSLSILSKC